MVKNIQGLRGLAVLFVLIAHMTVIEKKYFFGLPLLPEFLSVGISGVDIFFVISGYVMVSATRDWHQQYARVPQFLYKRAARIVPMYWVYSALVLVVFLIRPSMVNSAQGNQIQLVESFLLLPLPQGTYPLLAVGWSLVHEVYFYLVFAVLLVFPERFLAAFLVLWAAVVPTVYALQTEKVSATLQLVSHPLTYEFIAGCAIGLLARRPVLVAGRSVLCAALCWWLVAYAIFAKNVGWGMAPVDWRRLLVFGVPAALLVYGAVAVERTRGAFLPAPLRALGDGSYSIYLSHVLVISALGRLWAVLHVDNAALNAVALAGIAASAIVIGMLSYRWIEKPLHRRFQMAPKALP